MTVSGPNYASGYANESGSTWASETNAQSSTTGSYATWASSTANATGSIDYNGFGTWSDIPAGATIDSVVLSVKGYCSNTTRISAITHRVFIGATGKGSGATTVTRSTTSSNVYADVTYTDISLAELQGNTMAVRATVTHNNGTLAGTAYWDYFKITVNWHLDATVTGLSAVAGVAATPALVFVGADPNAQVTGLSAVAATASVPTVQSPRFVTDDAGVTDTGQSVESGQWTGPWWPATIFATAAIPEVTVSTTGGGDATVTGLSAVAGVAAVSTPLGISAGLSAAVVAGTSTVPAPTPLVLVAPAVVAGTAAISAPLGLSAGLTAAVVAGVAAVPAPLGLSAGLGATTVAAVAAVPAPLGVSAGLSATTVAGTAAVPAPLGLSAGLTATSVSVVGAVPAPLGISAGLSADVVAGSAAVPVPEIISSSGLSASADLTAGTSLGAEALLSGLTAVTVTAVSAVPTPGVSAGLTATAVVAVGAVPTVGVSAGLTVSVVAGTAVIPAPLQISAGLTAVTVAGVAVVPALLGLSAGLRAVTVVGVAAIPTVQSPTFVTDDTGVTDTGQSVESGQWVGPWWPATVLAFAAIPVPTAIGAVATQDATVTDLSAVAGAAVIPTLGISTGLTAAVVVGVTAVSVPLGISAGLTASTVAGVAAVPGPTPQVVVPATVVAAVAAVPAPLGISAGLSVSVVAGAASVPVPAEIISSSGLTASADLVAGTGLTADAAVTALTPVVVAATSAIPVVGLSTGLTAALVAGTAAISAPLGLSAGLTASVVTGTADVPAPAGITAQVSPVITDGEGITDAGQTIDRATGVADSATATEGSTTLNRGYEGADSAALASTASLGVVVADTEAGALTESVQVDSENLQMYEGTDSAALSETAALDFAVETSDDLGITEDEWESYGVTEIPEDDTGLADSFFIEPSATDSPTLIDGPYTLSITSAVSSVVGTLSESSILQIGDLRGVTSTDQHNLTDVAAIVTVQAATDSVAFAEGAVTLERDSAVTDEAVFAEETAFDVLVEAGDSGALAEETALEASLDLGEDTFALSVETADAGPKGFYGDVDSAALSEGEVAASAILDDVVEEAMLGETGTLDQGYASTDSATIVEVASRGFVQDVDDALGLTDEATTEVVSSTGIEDTDSATLDESTDLVTGTEQTSDDSATLTEDGADLFYEIQVSDLAALAESVAIEVLLVAADAGILGQFVSLFGPEQRPYARNGRAVLIPSPGMAPLSTVSGGARVTTMSGLARVVSGPGKVQVQSVPSTYTRADEP